ncbi:MAG: TIGR04255 family protein [Reyranella sp.]|uniref:TIGR04255 family protein n=1 Tax=Reyranella sp. TaxID=1929291 RepID=UPI001ACE6BB9|nr:TIGR04255 family protein [Reyranella sp.]MBN9088084.1 TIGR04255 family protein [Reyranella sp.]
MPQKYSKPPIVEAILQLRYGSALTDAELNRLPKLLQGTYPKSKPEADIELAVEIGKDGPATATQAHPNTIDTGARLISSDDQRTVITRSRSILFAYQAPYPGWDQFLAEAREVFDTVREKLGYRQLASVGLRYTNRIDVPLGASQETVVPGDYMVLGPALPNIPIFPTVRTYQLVADIDLRVDQLVARVQAATLEPALINHASLLLDIDIMAQHHVPQKINELWELVSRMRQAKNEIFEACVTEKARQLFGAGT